MQVLDELALVVGLEEPHLQVELAGELADAHLELVEGQAAVVLGGPAAEHVEVDAVHDLDAVFHPATLAFRGSRRRRRCRSPGHMAASVRRIAPWALVAAGCAAIAGWFGLRAGFDWNDYSKEALPAMSLLRQGDVHGFLAACPAYGGSLVLRSPFALLPRLWGGGDLAVYPAIAAPALLGLVAPAAWLANAPRRQGRGPPAAPGGVAAA